MARFAEEANYWNTTVYLAKSQAEIIELMEDFGAANLMVAQGQANGRFGWRGWSASSGRGPATALPSSRWSARTQTKRPASEASRAPMGSKPDTSGPYRRSFRKSHSDDSRGPPACTLWVHRTAGGGGASRRPPGHRRRIRRFGPDVRSVSSGSRITGSIVAEG
jgi:hypothetical protein